ncbi:MAG: methyltransferase domain-containing protein [Candidatus Dormibacteria bacterium]
MAEDLGRLPVSGTAPTTGANTESDYDHDVDIGDLALSYGKIAQRIPASARVLDIGCATGSFGLALTAERSCQVTGIEVNPQLAEKARTRGLEVLVADVQAIPLRNLVGGRQFDVIILADVLEHLLEPRELLIQLHELLAAGGRVLVSIPNITHVDIQVMLSQDEWRYRSSGLLDSTHLRFFTLRTFSQMAAVCGFDVVATDRVVAPFLGTEVLDSGRGLKLPLDQAEALRAVVAASNDNFQTYQHVLQLEPAPGWTGEQGGDSAPKSAAAAAEPDPNSAPAVVDVVVVSDGARTAPLATLLRSLRDQSHRSVSVSVVLRGADEAGVREVRRSLDQALLSASPERVVAAGPSTGAALNLGLQLASHEYVAFWTGDDSPSPAFLEQLVEVLQAHPWVAAAYGTLVVRAGDHDDGGWRPGGEIRSLGSPFDRLRMVSAEPVGLSSALFRVAHVRRIGFRFDDVPGGYPEWSWLASLGAVAEMEWCPPATMTTWVHPARAAPVPGDPGAEHQRLLAVAAGRDASLPVRAGREEVRSAMARMDRLTEELRAIEATSQEQLADAQQQLARVLSSRSWRLTRGLRRLTGSRLPR